MSGVAIDMILCKGGLDQVTPTMSLPNSFARYSLNFEAAVTGGYTRVAGYERYDGGLSPSQEEFIYVTVDSPLFTPAIGDSLITDNLTPTDGTLVYQSGGLFVLSGVTGSFNIGDTLSTAEKTVGMVIIPSLPIGVITSLDHTGETPEFRAQMIALAADQRRATITAVPGSGPIRGVFEYGDFVYAFRDNLLGNSCDLYRANFGWAKIAYLKTVSFTNGFGEPAEGDILTQGAVTSVIKRVVRSSGSWVAGDATGTLIIDTLAGGHYTAVAATTTSGTVVLSSVDSDIQMLPGGRFEFEEHNFAGQAATNRVYGCDGINKAFEFDGTILAPISTGATVDTPDHLCVHKNYLFLSLGSSVMHSAPGLQYCFDPIENASEMATGADVTGMVVMPGGTSTATLGIFNRSNTLILYGSSTADWNLVAYNTGTGSIPYTLQNMAQTYAMDDRGVNAVTTALQYGNFDSTALTNQVLPFINDRINKVTASILCRRKSQYRVYFDDGYGLYITLVNGKLLGCMPVYFPNSVTCTYEGKISTGHDVMYFGSTNGFVYQMESGTSFDGANIDFNLAMNFSNARSPRTLKRYRKCVPEITSANSSFARFNFSYMLGYDSVEYSQPVDFSYGKYTGASRWDQLVWDNFFWDTNTLDFLECYVEGTAENFAVLINGSYDYLPEFTINSFMLHYTPRRMMR